MSFLDPWNLDPLVMAQVNYVLFEEPKRCQM